LIVDKFYTSLKIFGEILQILGADEDVRVGECSVEEEGGGVGEGGDKVSEGVRRFRESTGFIELPKKS
jgi:hypothetical protein